MDVSRYVDEGRAGYFVLLWLSVFAKWEASCHFEAVHSNCCHKIAFLVVASLVLHDCLPGPYSRSVLVERLGC